MSVLLILASQRLAPRPHTLVQGFFVLCSVDNIVSIGPGFLTGLVVGAELQSQAGQIRDGREQELKEGNEGPTISCEAV